MQIHVKRIINPQRYLHALHPGDKFYVAVPLKKTDYSFLQFYGIHHDSPARIPVPCGPATTMNANGKWRILKDLPKEKRSIEHDYHIVDVFCQALFPKKSVKIPCFRQGIFPAFGGH